MATGVTSTGATGNQNDRILAELIHERTLRASYPKIVALQHCSFDSMAGAPAAAKAYPRDGDLGAAGTATEGTDISTVTRADLGTQLVNTPTEAAAVRFDVTDKLVRKRVPGIGAVAEALDSNNRGAVLNIYAEEFMKQRAMCFEKAEVDVQALLDDFTTVVGTTTVDLKLSDAESAIYQLTNKETGGEGEWVFLLAPIQLSDLRKEIAITGGGLGGGVWSTDVQSIVSTRPDVAMNGLRGALFGIPVYETSTSTNPSPNTAADEAGALMVSGGGRGPDDRPGALMFTEGEAITHRYQVDASERHSELFTIWEYAVGERADDMGISIISDA